MQGDAEALELAAAEMAESAAMLVQLEREMVALKDAPAEQRRAKEQARLEAAAVLERKMAAMEAVLAARRAPTETVEIEPEIPLEVAAPAPPLEVKPPVPRVAIGPAAGSGRELILQVRKHGAF
jgi:alpha-amylase